MSIDFYYKPVLHLIELTWSLQSDDAMIISRPHLIGIIICSSNSLNAAELRAINITLMRQLLKCCHEIIPRLSTNNKKKGLRDAYSITMFVNCK